MKTGRQTKAVKYSHAHRVKRGAGMPTSHFKLGMGGAVYTLAGTYL